MSARISYTKILPPSPRNFSDQSRCKTTVSGDVQAVQEKKVSDMSGQKQLHAYQLRPVLPLGIAVSCSWCARIFLLCLQRSGYRCDIFVPLFPVGTACTCYLYSCLFPTRAAYVLRCLTGVLVGQSSVLLSFLRLLMLADKLWFDARDIFRGAIAPPPLTCHFLLVVGLCW